MKLCYVCSEYPPFSHGGIGSVVETLACTLVQRGHRVRVIGTYPAGLSLPEYDERSGVQIWRLRETGLRFGWVPARRRLFKVLSRWCSRNEVDLIEAPDYLGPTALWPRLPVPVVTRLHGSVSYFAAELGCAPERITYGLEKASLRRADFICSVSRYTFARTAALFRLGCDADIIYNPVELFPQVSLEKRDRNRVVFTGTLTPKKGIVSLIKAWPAVKSMCNSAELHIFGKDGKTESGKSMQSYLLSLLGAEQHDVYFHGHVPRERVIAELGTARAAVFPSYAESFGLAPLEALAQGCPTIYTKHEPGPEIMRDHIDGLLIHPDNPKEIANAIVSLLNNDGLAQKLGAAGYQQVSDKFSPETVISRNEDFYLRCMQKFQRDHSPSSQQPRCSNSIDQNHDQDSAKASLRCLSGWRLPGNSPLALEDCSLVVATYQRPRQMVALLNTIDRLPDQPGEIVVVDGSDGTDTEVAVSRWSESRRASFELVYVRSPKGLTRQRNVGIDISRAQYVFFLDDDCLPEAGYFSSMRKVFVKDRSGQVGAVTGLIVNEMNRPVPRRWRIRLALGLVPRLPPRIYHPSGTSVPRNTIPCFSGVRSVDIVDGGASVFRREVFAEHRFSEFFYGYAQGEDLEMSLRVRRRWQILWCGDAHVNHNHAPDGRPTSYRKAFMEVRNRYFIWKRHSPDADRADRARFWLDILFLMSMDLAWFLARPTHPHVLAHGFGLASATLRCLFSPPSYTEPLPRQQYALQVDEAQS